jgi:hypothetical protein
MHLSLSLSFAHPHCRPTNEHEQAHFSIKPEWLEGQYINSSTYSDLVFAATNELDWPHKSWVSGHVQDPFVDSLYLRLRKQNLCNHRDYQNVAGTHARMLRRHHCTANLSHHDVLGYLGVRSEWRQLSEADEHRADGGKECQL